MPVVAASNLLEFVSRLYCAAGATDETANFLAQSMVTNNLMGHDSHGVALLPFVLGTIRDGRLKPDAIPSLEKETETSAIVSGNWTFGQVALRYAVELAIQKSSGRGMAAVGVVCLNHTGRLGQFAEMIARAGMFGMLVQGGSRDYRAVAPYGGRSRMFRTNPYAFALPAGQSPPVVVDFATSSVAEAKLSLARATGQPLPTGLIIDSEGRPSTRVEDYFDGGALLPFGAHKGYGLALLAELLGTALTCLDRFSEGGRGYGLFVLAVNIEAFRPLAEFGQVVDTVLAEVRAVPPAEGFDQVLIPGEPELRSRASREKSGIPIPDSVWNELLTEASRLGITLDSNWPGFVNPGHL